MQFSSFCADCVEYSAAFAAGESTITAAAMTKIVFLIF